MAQNILANHCLLAIENQYNNFHSKKDAVDQFGSIFFLSNGIRDSHYFVENPCFQKRHSFYDLHKHSVKIAIHSKKQT